MADPAMPDAAPLSMARPAPSVAAVLASADDEAFRRGVHAWLEREFRLLAGPRWGHAAIHDMKFRRQWENHLCQAGWSGLAWPRQYGGHALSLARLAIFHEEYARLDAPLPVNMIGHGILGPTLLLYGSDEQKQRFLPALLRNEHLWCQCYSEPESGSDLASLRTSASRTYDGYRLTGQKIWTSFANQADWCFVLARTADVPAKHRGIGFFLVDMRSPGVRVRPIRQITGEADYNEVFFDDVHVPIENLVGAENGGWAIAMAAAGFERGTYFVPRIARMQVELEALVRLAARQAHGAGRALDDAGIRDRIGRSWLDIYALRLSAQQILAQAERGGPPGVEGSMLKLLWSESHQRLLDLAIDVLGPAVQFGPQETAGPREGRWQRDYLWSRAETILAGTSEIQRNIVAERGLGLPR